jgi:hypothetical protein
MAQPKFIKMSKTELDKKAFKKAWLFLLFILAFLGGAYLYFSFDSMIKTNVVITNDMMGVALDIGIVFSTLLMFYFMWIGSYIVLSALMNKYKEVKA